MADNAVAYSEPSKCTLLPNNASFAEGADLQKLEWSGWGTPKATAHGCDHGFHLDAPCAPVTVVVSRLDGGYYTRVTVRGGPGARHYTPDAPGSTAPSESDSGGTSTQTASPDEGCAGGRNSEGNCLSDPEFRLICQQLYDTWKSKRGGPEDEEAQAAIQKYGHLLCDQSP